MRNIHESVIMGENVSIECENVTIGKYSKIVYGNDLNNEYISINADYRS